ncbi:SDR family NAD(P)-dependent oxidoreductase [Candidatus Latescibacterota bacterium]
MKSIVITGVTRGCGRSMTDWFIKNGHTVSGCGRSVSAIDELKEHYTAPHYFEAVDLTSPELVCAWAEHVVRENGVPDLLINNAGFLHQPNLLWDIPIDEIKQTFDINVMGVTTVCHAFLPYMVEKETGVIIAFSSRAGLKGMKHLVPYCASKWAIEGMMKSIASGLPQEMAAIPLNPTDINTEMLQKCDVEYAKTMPSATDWAEIAAPFILSLNQAHNGKSITVPIPGYEL